MFGDDGDDVDCDEGGEGVGTEGTDAEYKNWHTGWGVDDRGGGEEVFPGGAVQDRKERGVDEYGGGVG